MRQKLKAGILLFLLAIIFTIPAYADDTDAWLDGWDYEISGSNMILKGYTGEGTDLDIYGKATIDGSAYATVINYDASSHKSAFTGNTGIRSLSFHAMDGQKVKGSNQSSMAFFFSGMSSLESISFGDGFDSSGIQDMQSAFNNDSALTSIDIDNLDISSCGTLAYTFSGCSSLRSMEISAPYTYGFSGLFKDCSSLESVKVTAGRDGGSFTSLKGMFEGCSALKSYSLANFKTGGEKDFSYLFKGCSSLESIDLSVLDFSSATDVKFMLQGCSSLRTIDISPVVTPKLTDMSYMLVGCRSLESLDLSGLSWNSSGVLMNQIISTCPNLKEIIVDENVRVSSSTYGIGGEESPVRTKVVGKMSDSFRTYFFNKLQYASRYLTSIDVRASISLVGDDTYDSWDYGVLLSNSTRTKVANNNGADSIYFSGVENGLYIYAPGEITITLTQGTAATLYGTTRVTAVTETEDGFRCGNNPITKTINVIRNDDGSISIEEI